MERDVGRSWAKAGVDIESVTANEVSVIKEPPPHAHIFHGASRKDVLKTKTQPLESTRL